MQKIKQITPVIYLLWMLFNGLHFNEVFAQADYYVNQNTPCTTGCDGISWAKAFDNLQAAIDAAAANDEIWVAEGKYLPTQALNGSTADSEHYTFYFDFDVKLYGGFPNTSNPTMADRDVNTYKTFLSGDLNNNDGADFANNSDNVNTVVHLKNVSSNFTLSGFFIEAGNGSSCPNNNFSTFCSGGGGLYNDGSGTGNSSNPTIQACIFQNNRVNMWGGAVYNNGSNKGESSPNFINCIFQKNQAYDNNFSFAGAVYNSAGEGGNSSPTFTKCIFQNNRAYNNVSSGGAVQNYASNGGKSSPIFTKCTFQNNQAKSSGGAVFNVAARGTKSESSPIFTDCIFQNNQAGNSGGAVYNFGNYGNQSESSSAFTNCTFLGNKADDGGAVYNNGLSGVSFATFTNCIFQNNEANNDGGAVYNNGGNSSPTFTNCTFQNNQADANGGGVLNNGNGDESSPTFTNCIFWQNAAISAGNSLFNEGNANPQISYTLLQDASCPTGATCGVGMIYNQDPLFVDPANENLRISPCSPVLNAGNNSADLDGNGSGIQTISEIATDLEGNNRIIENTVDMGAYESIVAVYHVNQNTPCTADCDGTSWAKAFDNLQAAIDVVCVGNEIWVAEGKYIPSKDKDSNAFPADNREKTFYFDKDVKIYGGFPDTGNPNMTDRDWENHPTILSGDLDNNDVSITDKTNPAFPAQNNGENAYTVIHSIEVSSDFVIGGCIIQGGNANIDASGISPKDSGGGMYNDDGNPTITDCSFSNNSVLTTGGGILNFSTSSPIITNCHFSNNAAEGSGGGASNYSNASATFINCRFSNNLAEDGGGMNNDNSWPSIVNCSFSNNSAENEGGGMCGTFFGTSTVTNCSFSNNSAEENGGGIAVGGEANVTLTNCILWDNGTEIYNEGTSAPTVTYSIIQGGYAGIGNLDQDPLFIDPANNDLRLSDTSPAIEVGYNLADLDGSGAGTQTIEDVPFDLAGNPRLIDFDENTTATVDMGAFESAVPLEDVPTLSQWGLLNLALLLMICGTLYLINPPQLLSNKSE